MPTESSTSLPVATVEKKTPRAAPATPQTTRNAFDAGTRSDGTLTISAPDLAQLSEHQNTTEYWCGATMDSLIQTIDVKGVSFPRWTNIREVSDKLDPSGQPVFLGGQPDLGTFVRLTDQQVAAFIKAVQRRVLRRFGKSRGQIMDIDHQGYRADSKRDRPLGEVLYMVPVEQMTGKTRLKCPTPLISKE